MNIPDRYLALKHKIEEKALSCRRDPNEITLVVVTKTQPIEAIQQVYEAGCRQFGENRVQEALEKISSLPSDIQWHLIGTLQSNKINKAVPLFGIIHSVDSVQLAQQISATSEKKGVITPVLLQVNTSGEGSKHGLSVKEWRQQLDLVAQLAHIQLEGLMTMAPFTKDEGVIRLCFQQLRHFREECQDQVKLPHLFRHLSMGMSNDYLIAIEEGATLLRIGSAVFSYE